LKRGSESAFAPFIFNPTARVQLDYFKSKWPQNTKSRAGHRLSPFTGNRRLESNMKNAKPKVSKKKKNPFVLGAVVYRDGIHATLGKIVRVSETLLTCARQRKLSERLGAANDPRTTYSPY
jgi:hypothetical protein